MTERSYVVGERVLARPIRAKTPRFGVVQSIITGDIADYVWGKDARYMVLFDGDGGYSGPCVVLRAEGEREDESPRTGTAA